METFFALVLTIVMTDGEYQDVVIDVYDNQQQCQAAAVEQKINAECWPVKDIIHNDSLSSR